MSFIYGSEEDEEFDETQYLIPTKTEYPSKDVIEDNSFYKEEAALYRSDLYMLRLWCLPDPRIPPSVTKTQLVQFFYASDCNVIKAYELILNHYAYTKEYTELFTNRNPIRHEDIINAWAFMKFASFPVPTDGSRIFYVGLYPNEGRFINVVSLLKVFLMGVEASLLCEGIAKGGYSVIVDTRDFPVDISVACYKTIFLKYLPYFLKGLQIKVKWVFFLFYAGFDEKLSHLRTYLTKKYNKKVLFHICGSVESLKLYELIPTDNLPKSLNGFLADDVETLTLKMRSMIELSVSYFKREELQRVNLPDASVGEQMKKKADALRSDACRHKKLWNKINQLKKQHEKKKKDYLEVINTNKRRS